MTSRIVDTDVLIDYLRDREEAVAFVEAQRVPLLLSVVTVAELYAGVRDGEERQRLEGFLQAFDIVPLDAEMARRGGLHRRDYGKSHGTGLADGLIAATAEAKGARLATLNAKHFPMLGRVITPYDK